MVLSFSAHVKSSMMGCSLTIPIKGGRFCLGIWQVGLTRHFKYSILVPSFKGTRRVIKLFDYTLQITTIDTDYVRSYKEAMFLDIANEIF